MDVPTTLRLVRRWSGLSLRALAERAGTSHATLAAYESGRTTPRVDTLDRILRAAGYASAIATAPCPDASIEERESKGRELVAALLLAAHFPAEHDRLLAYPQFPRGPDHGP